MRLIDADIAKENCKLPTIYDLNDTPDFLDEQPTVDAFSVVRCKDCYKRNKSWCPCGDWTLPQDNDYCSYGEKRDMKING
jgi:hypothetical protein